MKKNKKIEGKIIPNPSSSSKRCRVLSEDCKFYFMNKTNQFEVLSYENTTINDNYFQKKYVNKLKRYATQLFSIKDTKENRLNSFQNSDDFYNNPKNYFSNRNDSFDIAKVI